MDLATQLMLEAFGGGPHEWPYTPEEWEARARESIHSVRELDRSWIAEAPR